MERMPSQSSSIYLLFATKAETQLQKNPSLNNGKKREYEKVDEEEMDNIKGFQKQLLKMWKKT